jgi:hypothetical protein
MRFFEELDAIITSILSLNLKVGVWLVTVFGGMTLGAITGFVTNWVYDTAEAYYALIGLIFADHLSGMYLAYKNNKFETRKATRIFWTLCSHTALLIFGCNLAKGSIAISWLDESIFVPLCLVNLISLVKNLSLLGFIKKDFANWFYNKIDVYKNDYTKKKPDSDDSDSDDGC